MSKTVYILGAGFSIPAGAPSQFNLVKQIFLLRQNQQGNDIVRWVDEFEKFLTNSLCISKDKINDVSLEDIFTPLDRCLIDEISFRDNRY